MPREVVKNDTDVGFVWNKERQEYIPTRAFVTVCSRWGVHAFPDYPRRAR